MLMVYGQFRINQKRKMKNVPYPFVSFPFFRHANLKDKKKNIKFSDKQNKKIYDQNIDNCRMMSAG